MRNTGATFDRLHAAIDGDNPLDLRFRELRNCASLLEMHVAEEESDPLIIDAIGSLFAQLAKLRGLPDDRCREAARVIDQTKKLPPRSAHR